MTESLRLNFVKFPTEMFSEASYLLITVRARQSHGAGGELKGSVRGNERAHQGT